MGDVTSRSPKYQLIEDRLGSDLAAHIRKARADDVSYESIARALWAATGVEVTAQTVSNWDAALSPTEPEAAAS